MRIGIFVTTFFPYETVMGVSNTAYLIARRLVEDYDADVFIFAPVEKNENQKEKEDIFNLHIRRFDTRGPKSLGIFSDFNTSEKFDIVHSYHYGYYPASAGMRFAKKNDLPHFFTTAYHPHQMNVIKGVLFKLYNMTEGKNLLKNSYTVLPFNDNEMRQLLPISEGNYRVLPSPINTDVFYPKRKKNKQIVIGYVGNFLPWKGADVAFELCKELESERYDVSFVFIGRGFLESYIKKNASQRFTFLNDIPIGKLAEWYNKIDILIYPSQYESFGRILAEAATCGVATVSTNAGAIPETLGPGGLLVEYGDWKGMKENIIKLIENKQLRFKLSKAGIKHARRFDYRVVAHGVYRMYEDAI